jgi:hypothetical protein
VSHYSVTHDPEAGEWFFTSPLGRHGGFTSEKPCERIMAKVAVAHCRRSSDETVEGRLLADYFAAMGEPKIPEEAFSTRPLAPDASPCKSPFKYHAWPIPVTDDAKCERCGVVRADYEKAREKAKYRRQQARKLEQALNL